MSVKHRLIDGRKSRWSSEAGPKTHLVGDGPKNILEQPPTLCGKYVSGHQHTGPLSKVTCERCLVSLNRQKESAR